MGNAISNVYSKCCKTTTAGDTVLLRSHGASASDSGLSALARDILNFESTSQVPEGLSEHVVSSKKAQANWYRKLADAWGEAKPLPKTPEEASRFVIKTLKRHLKADVEGLLSFYGLPLPSDLDDDPEVVKFELHTLPVDVKSIPDGDTITVYVNTKDPRESSLIPKEVKTAAVQRSQAQARKDNAKADDLDKIIMDAGYRIITSENDEDVLARKYRIRFSGIDAPESKMPYGKEAKEEMVSLVGGKSVKVLVYTEDRYGRFVGDVYCNGEFVQETMLKKGLAWHYTAYDKRSELAEWEKEARAKRAGLWAQENPEAPWDWRKNRREGN